MSALRLFRLLLWLPLLLPAAAWPAPPSEFGAPPGLPVYVDFWASWCVPCAQSFPWLNELRLRYRGELHVVGVNVDEKRADAERFLKRHPAQFDLVFDPDGALAGRYRLKGMPSAVLLAPDGRVLWQHSGFRRDEIPEYERAIERALK